MKMKNSAPSSVRIRTRRRLLLQNHTLNYLRLRYFLSPENLKKEGLDMNDIGSIDRLLDLLNSKFDLPKTWGMDEELLIFLRGRDFFLNDLYPWLANNSHITAQQKKEFLEDAEARLYHHFLWPDGIPIYFKFKKLKGLDLNKFIEKVVVYQNLELKKSQKGAEERRPITYLDYLKKDLEKNPKALYLKSAIRRAQMVERGLVRERVYSQGKMTDRDIAFAIYKSSGQKALQSVRQDRRRLKNYHFL
jgi:hypothetical protein